MDRKLISTGSPFESQVGYSRAVVQSTDAGQWCFVSGTTGYDYKSMTMPETIEAQTKNAMETICSALGEGGFELANVVRARYIITNAQDRMEAFKILGQYFGDIRPAATMIVAGLIEPEMKIEIEVTAYRAA